MELIISVGGKPTQTQSDTKSDNDFPANTSWKDEVSKLVSQAYEIASKGNGDSATQVSNLLQMVLDTISEDKPRDDKTSPEDDLDKDIEKMSNKKKDYINSSDN